MSDYVNLHTHSEYSQLDGCGKMTAFMEKAKSQGQEAIAFTEHGNIRQLTKLHEESEAIGIRPIYGVELYLSENMHRKGLTPEERAEATKDLPKMAHREAIYQYEKKHGIIGRYHLTVLAKDQDGLRNLMRIVTLGWTKGFYKRPRVDMACLTEHAKGLLVMSGCQSGSIGHGVLNNDRADAIAKVGQLYETFGEDFYGEIMPHNMVEQVQVNQAVKMFSGKLNLEMVATQDAHYIEPEDWLYQEAMLCIHTRTNLNDPKRFKFSTHDFWLKDRAAMEETFRLHHGYFGEDEVKSMLDNTLNIAEKCQAKLEMDRFKALVPSIPIPDEFSGDEFAWMSDLCKKGWQSRGLDQAVEIQARRKRLSVDAMRKVYINRLTHELARIRKQKVVRYFLVVWDLYNWVRSQKIEVGPGRGSVGGSLVAFLLGITDVDPIQFDLLFERFLSPDRIDMPDVDMDFEDARREEIITYLKTKYGEDYTAHVGTNNKLTGKACLKDIARVMSIPIHEIQPVVDAIVERSSGDERASMTIEDSFKEFPVCQAFHKKYPLVLEYAQKLEGQVKAVGIHAAGIVVSPIPLIEVCPLEVRQDKVATAVDMYGVGNLGLMKMDVLGLRNLTTMRRCCQAIKERHGVEVDWLTLPLDDEQTLDGFTEHNYIGIFQYDTTAADKICEGVEFTSFDDVAAMVALNRPGTARSGLATEYLKRKKNPKAIKSIHPLVDEICKDTLGVIVYQEHVMRIFTDVAGFSPATADSLRRKIAKKYGDEAIAKERAGFVSGAVAKGVDKELAEKLISQITFFGSYGFNKSHSVEYGLISYREMWLKTHYPREFMWALMDVEPDSDKVTRLVRATRKMDINVMPPDVNTADPSHWSLVGDDIFGAITNIKGVGPAAVQAISETRPFESFADFANRVNRRAVHKGVVTALIRSGALNALVPNPKWLSENLEAVWGMIGKADWQQKMTRFLEVSKKAPQWSEEDAQIIAAEINPLASGTDPLEPYKEMVETLRNDWIRLDSDRLWENSHGFLWGRVIEVKYNQVGDFHSGAEPDELEKARMGWGKRYANLNVEDVSGRNQRVKVDTDGFEDFREIIDKGVGTIVGCHVTIGKQFHSIRASYMVDLDVLRKKMIDGSGLTVLEESLYQTWRPGGKPMMAGESAAVLTTTAFVARVMNKIDKKGNEMAFIGLLCADGNHREAICFASSWPDFKAQVRQGVIAKFKLMKDKKSFILDNDVLSAVTLVA